MKNRRRLFITALLMVLTQCVFARYTRLSLSDAIKNKIVKLEASSMSGSYQGKTTMVKLTNNSKDGLQVKIDIGTVLVPEDSKYQPMILAGEEYVTVGPSGSGQVVVQTFCGNSPKSCPHKDLKFSYAGLENDTLITVLTFIKTQSIFDEMGQSAVWAVTNEKDLANVYDLNRPALSLQLLDVLCKATGRPKPEYFQLNAPMQQVPGEPAYVPKPLAILATFTVVLDAPKVLTLGVYDEAGEMIQPVFEDKEFGKSGHIFDVKFEAVDVRPGKYYIRLKESAGVVQEKMVQVN